MEISHSDLQHTQRLDPEFYISNFNDKKGGIYLSQLADIRIGTTPKEKTLGDTPFYRVEDVSIFGLRTPKTHLNRSLLSNRFIAKKGDILITIKGRIGDVALVDKEGFYNQDIACISAKDTDPVVLLALLSSRYIKEQIKKLSTNQMHPFIRASDVRKIQIPQLGKIKNKKIRSITKSILILQKEIEDNESNIENMFDQNTSIQKSRVLLSQLQNANRIDAEYFTRQSSNTICIKDLLNISVNIGKYKNKFEKSGTPYLRAKDIKNGKVSPGLFVKFSEMEVTHENEILLSRVGNIKAICINNEKLIPSDNFLRINFRDERIFPHVLTLFFVSQAGKDEIERHMQGSKQRRINKKGLLNLQIPQLEKNEQKKLVKILHQTSQKTIKRKEFISKLDLLFTDIL